MLCDNPHNYMYPYDLLMLIKVLDDCAELLNCFLITVSCLHVLFNILVLCRKLTK
ncbi:hypothetical protein HanIR_Chr17g0864881 [Helianthus annuus]|nr:hypothetical protein HanIR_Chr17g0864881 [Helianthus annuus]